MTSLMRFAPGLAATTREGLRNDPAAAGRLHAEDAEEVRREGEPVDARPLVALLTGAAADKADAVATDALLAPWVHATLRLTRAEAADPSMWEWLAAIPCRCYVTWRWANSEGITAANRWRGPINKQAIARLWWGAELLRDGDDYAPVRKFFALQDFPNSYLHRRFLRSRPMALGILDAVQEATARNDGLTSRQVNDVARVVNLSTAGVSIPRLSAGYSPEAAAYRGWIEQAAGGAPPADLTSLPTGPPDGRVPDEPRTRTLEEARRMCLRAGL